MAADAPVGNSACPICGKPQAEAYRPFCSKRCADVDLSRWLNGVYAVPAAEQDDEEDADGLPPPPPPPGRRP